MKKERTKILVIVEGAKTDVRLMEHLLNVYGIINICQFSVLEN